MNKAFRLALAALALLASAPALPHGRVADLSVFDRTEGRRLQVYRHENRAYVVGKPGNEYQISLRSRQQDEVLAVVSVDGVNVITGQTADPAQSGYVLGPRAGLDIGGWRRSMSETAAFYFTALGDSYAARTGRPDNVGVIGVALFRKKAPPPPLPFSSAPSAAPAEMARAEAGAARAQDRLGTGHGRHEASPAIQVQFERASQAPAEIITLHYDSHANLVARGVIRQPLGYPPRYPAPFPGFVPDPPA